MLLLLLCIVYRSGLLLQLFELDSQALLVTCTLTIQPRISPFLWLRAIPVSAFVNEFAANAGRETNGLCNVHSLGKKIAASSQSSKASNYDNEVTRIGDCRSITNYHTVIRRFPCALTSSYEFDACSDKFWCRE